MLGGVRFERRRMAEAAADEMIAATDVADLLVRLGVPFRESHGIVAGLVRAAVDAAKPLSQLTEDELSAHSTVLGAHESEFRAVLRSASWLESKISEGGTSSARLHQQLGLARGVLEGDAAV